MLTVLLGQTFALAPRPVSLNDEILPAAVTSRPFARTNDRRVDLPEQLADVLGLDDGHDRRTAARPGHCRAARARPCVVAMR